MLTEEGLCQLIQKAIKSKKPVKITDDLDQLDNWDSVSNVTVLIKIQEETDLENDVFDTKFRHLTNAKKVSEIADSLRKYKLMED